MIPFTGGLLAAAGAMLFYLASPHQKLCKPTKAPRVLNRTACILLALGTILMLFWAGPATAIFIVMTVVMAVWSIIPVVIAWRRGAPEKTQ